MAGYGVKQSRIHTPGHPDVPLCVPCEDTGFVICGGTLRACPACSDEETFTFDDNFDFEREGRAAQ